MVLSWVVKFNAVSSVLCCVLCSCAMNTGAFRLCLLQCCFIWWCVLLKCCMKEQNWKWTTTTESRTLLCCDANKVIQDNCPLLLLCTYIFAFPDIVIHHSLRFQTLSLYPEFKGSSRIVLLELLSKIVVGTLLRANPFRGDLSLSNSHFRVTDNNVPGAEEGSGILKQLCFTRKRCSTVACFMAVLPTKTYYYIRNKYRKFLPFQISKSWKWSAKLSFRGSTW